MDPNFAAIDWPAVGLRGGIVAGALLAWFWTQSLIASKPASEAVVGDVIHDLTANWHRYFAQNQRAANVALMTSSFFIDLIGLALIGAALFGATFAPFLGILFVFGLRQICQGLCTLPPPPGIIWRNPGFPTLLVTYKVGNDFFFSGHTALAVLGALEAAYLGPAWLAAIAACVALGEIATVLVLRAHYTLDVVAGALAAFLAAELAAKLSPNLDRYFL
jgi:membrane-associated phospholipid phosphatase